VIIETPEDMEALGARIAADLRAGDLVLLNGELGAGKTTFTRGLGEALGVRGAVTSPTFVLARTHPRMSPGSTGEPPLVHVDAYRLGSALELDDLDIDFEGSIVVVEWGDGLLDGVAESWLRIDIERPRGGVSTGSTGMSGSTGMGGGEGDDGVEPRSVTISGVGPRWEGVSWDAPRD
jgi:tRNA threonylcarbamoyl adenosine modification protein YjeE